MHFKVSLFLQLDLYKNNHTPLFYCFRSSFSVLPSSQRLKPMEVEVEEEEEVPETTETVAVILAAIMAVVSPMEMATSVVEATEATLQWKEPATATTVPATHWR